MFYFKFPVLKSDHLKNKNNISLLRVVSIFIALLISGMVNAQEGVGWSWWPAGTLGPYSTPQQCNSRGTFAVQVTDAGAFLLAGTDPVGTTINSNALQEGITAVPDGQGIETTYTFTYPVEDVNFSIFDVDGAAGSWQDRIIINPTLATVPQTANLSCPLGLNNCAYTISGNQADAGTTATPATGAAGRLDVNVPGPIDSITIQYRNHTVPISTTQYIWLSSISWSCAIVGVAKQMTRRAGQAFGVSPYIVDIDFNFTNYGHLTLTNLTSLEDLDAVFNVAPFTGNYTVTSIALTTGPATFTANGAFNGSANQELIGTSSSLLAGETASIRVTVEVAAYSSYTNTVTLNATTPQLAITSDVSTDGTNPDGADADNNPDESTPSVLNTTTLPISLNYLSSQENQGNIDIKWQTDIEFGHIGFKIFQEDASAQKYELSDFIYQPDNKLGQSLKSYSTSVSSPNQYPIWLAEYNNKGEITWYGPFAVNTTTGTKIENSQIDWSTNILANKQNTSLKTTNNTLAIEVDTTGMQRISYADLINAGMSLSSTTPKNISITLNNQPVPIFINGNKQQFDSSTSIDFYAYNIDSLYANKRIYKLNINTQASIQIKLDTTNPSTVIDTWYWQIESYSPNLVYDFSSPTIDPWRAETLATFGVSSKTIEFPLDEMADIDTANILLDLQVTGAIDYQQMPDIYPTDPNRCGANFLDLYSGMTNDHCIEIMINNQPYDDLVFDGLTVFNKQYQLEQNASATGVVRVDLNLTGESGFPHDIVNIEDISIQYPRNLYAINDFLQFTIANSSVIDSDLINYFNFDDDIIIDSADQQRTNKASILIDGFSQDEVIAYALNPKAPVRIGNLQVQNTTNGYAIKIPSIAQNHTYWISTKQALIKPNLKPWHNAQIIDSRNIEYIMISHPDFMEAVQPLKDYHQANGLNVEIINVKDIYAKYSESIVDAYAIKKYITELAKNNTLKYVLLIGADNYDYKGYLSSQSYSHIPSIYTAIGDVVRYTPTDSLYVDIDNDNVPDLAIGRLPVRTIEELQLLIDKQMVFINHTGQNLSSHFIADTSNSYHSYSQISNELFQLLPEPWTALSTYRDDFSDAEETKQSILTNFALNPRLTTYLGHSGPRNWFSFPSAFTYNDIASLTNSTSPSVVMQWGCWNSYYVEPEANTMAHKFLFENNNGAVAVFGASTLTNVTSEIALAQAIIPEMMKKTQTIGTSMLNAKKILSENSDYVDVVIGWILLGDPALRLTY